MNLKNKKAWDEWVSKNKDPYGKCCVDVAREAMKELDEDNDFECHKIICDADKAINAGGITGFMAGCVAQMITVCHKRGDEFQKKWNKGYGVEESSGVVNPALMTINIK